MDTSGSLANPYQQRRTLQGTPHGINSTPGSCADSRNHSSAAATTTSTSCYYSISSLSSPLALQSVPYNASVDQKKFLQKQNSSSYSTSMSSNTAVITNPYKKMRMVTQCASSSSSEKIKSLHQTTPKPINTVVTNPYVKPKKITTASTSTSSISLNDFRTPNNRVRIQTKPSAPMIIEEYPNTQPKRPLHDTNITMEQSSLITPMPRVRLTSPCHQSHTPSLSSSVPLQRQHEGGEIRKLFLVEALTEDFKTNQRIMSDQSSKHRTIMKGSTLSRQIQIMGHVMTEPYSVVYQGEDYIAFCFDDGTAMVDVLYKNHSLEKLQKHEQLLSSLSLPPLMQQQVKMGSCIDCKGTIQYVRTFHGKDHDNEDKYDAVVPCFIVYSISFVMDPNLEVLRMSHLAHGVNSKKRTMDMLFGNDNVQRKLVDNVRLLHLIGVSPPKGLTRKDLEVLFQIETEEEKWHLMSELKALQSSYDIYTSRDGAYMPI
mmetsp:Transcript_62/g.112  ORF Transcript_62/g.112 Transcript_62/m.112 type:complete len:485 (+) Transcript_62:104-1558(+)